LFLVEMEINEEEIQDILGNDDTETHGTRGKKKRKAAKPVVPMPMGSTSSSGAALVSSDEGALVKELAETKLQLAQVTEEMEDMKNEMSLLKSASIRPLRIFALGFVPSVVLAKTHVDMLKWVADVLSVNLKKRMESHPDHFRILSTISCVDSVGVRTCPVFNRLEYCALKWHHNTKMANSGRVRADLRIHCCTLCLEAIGIICGHPLLRCPWIYEDTWKKIPGSSTANEIRE
jgi:hypothetical protein